ncbi:hypothetical protein JOC54_002125 [Alkalihalobacillus xiaoxiensis]|uniref:Spore protein YkvP/CgeB glycosyl transferase-like domain-containing protein n=1 Tax=Shouchella xiaoxiensis TaxID=766895 RepID=A0ABS2STP2_9BACI|nr:glycosyltransferase [Shouchella xiaoxiensis]MBM7838866.1 hypothetical protein [Shouchella xiaoxiensis]
MAERRLFHLLFIAKDTSTYIDRNYSYLERELATHVQVTVWRKSGHLQSILKQLTVVPDFIIIVNDIGKKMEPVVHGLATTLIPSALFVNDVHRFTEKRRQFLRKNPNTYVFSVTRDACYTAYPEFADRIRWLPHFVEPRIFKDYQLEKNYELLLLGAVGAAYPFREHLLKTFANDSNFIYRPHPGYTFDETDRKGLVGKRYAMELNKAKLFFTCPSLYGYPVKKYYEALACHTLLLAPSFNELEDLGFKPGTHFIKVDEENVAEATAYYLHQHKERELVAQQGHLFIHKNHSTAVRTKQLIDQIEEILYMKGK